MWVIKWNIVSRGKRDFMREMFNEGKILQFEWEEDGSRFLEGVRSGASGALPISYTIQRFAGDRREKYKLVKQSTLQRTIEDVLCGIENESKR